MYQKARHMTIDMESICEFIQDPSDSGILEALMINGIWEADFVK